MDLRPLTARVPAIQREGHPIIMTAGGNREEFLKKLATQLDRLGLCTETHDALKPSGHGGRMPWALTSPCVHNRRIREIHPLAALRTLIPHAHAGIVIHLTGHPIQPTILCEVAEERAGDRSTIRGQNL